MSNLGTILLIDDEPDILSVLQEYFEEKGYRVFSANTGEDGTEIVRREHPNLVVVDLRLPGMDGTQVLEEIRKTEPDLPVVIITAYPSFESAVIAIRARAYDYLVKPFQMSYLGVVVEKAIKEHHLTRQSEKLEKRLAEARKIVDRVKHKT